MTSQEWIDGLREKRAKVQDEYHEMVMHLKNLSEVSDFEGNEEILVSTMTAEILMLKSNMEKMSEEL